MDREWPRVPPDTWNPVGSREDHLPRLNTTWWPIVKQYREGKVKRTPEGEWNRIWNRVPTTGQSTVSVWWRAFCRTSQRVVICSKVKYLRYEAEGKPSLNRAASCMLQTRNRVTYPWTGWSESKISWRTEPHWCWKTMGWAVDSGEIPIELGDSWFSSK